MSVMITNTLDFSPGLIFNCGQCFRFTQYSGDIYKGTALGKILTLKSTPQGIELNCTQEEYDNLWHNYFDMSQDYSEIRRRINISPFMSEACEYGRGIRILRQDFWEALCSFIISQCNNIKRIEGIITRLCQTCGEYIKGDYYAFPSAGTVSELSLEQLRELGTGYRAPYIKKAAYAVASGALSPGLLNAMSFNEAKKRLCNEDGIGEKVASCILLYGLHRTEAFPIDVWMKRGLKEFFPKNFDFRDFGQDAGIAQQYIFHYTRYLHNKLPKTDNSG